MTIGNAIEIVQSMHPDVPVPMIAQYLKVGYRDFTASTKIYRLNFDSPNATEVDRTLDGWNIPYQIPFSELSTAAFEPLGVRSIYYDGESLPEWNGDSQAALRFRIPSTAEQIEIIGRPYVTGLVTSRFSVDAYGFDPRIIASTGYTEDFNFNNPDFDMFAVNHTLMLLNMRINQTVKASYYERENRRIRRAAMAQLQDRITTNHSIQVRY